MNEKSVVYIAASTPELMDCGAKVFGLKKDEYAPMIEHRDGESYFCFGRWWENKIVKKAVEVAQSGGTLISDRLATMFREANYYATA